MSDLVLETNRAVIVCLIFVKLWLVGGKEDIRRQEGWLYILIGFALILFGMLIDITDNFPGLNNYILIGDTEYQAFLEKVVGYLFGFLLLTVGFWKWMPTVILLREAERELIRSHKILESKVKERTAELMMNNERLQREIEERKRAEEALRESKRRYRELSIKDGLTKLYNSRHFFSHLKAEASGADRYSRPLSLLLLDIDNFKYYNDRYGHLEGDKVLAKIGEDLLGSLRETDSAHRYGGEEFTVILPETGGKEATNVAEKIRKRLETETFYPRFW